MHGRRITYNILPLILCFLSGCVSLSHPDYAVTNTERPEDRLNSEAYHRKVVKLQTDLAALNLDADPVEARKVAETAIDYSAELAAEYQLIRPAVLHNMFVRMGFKDRGLCYHWTEDLLKRLQTLVLKTYQLHWAVAHRGSELREHNSVVVTAKGQAFENGIVLDPWRNSGDLYWAVVKTDRYPWMELPPSEW